MGYRDDLYQARNIIGYTGDHMYRDRVTVYFQSGGEFGRITQYYPDDQDNVGRNKVRCHHDYRIYNSQTDGCAVEFYNGAIQHESRSPFVAVAGNELLRFELAKSILAHPNLKPKYGA